MITLLGVACREKLWFAKHGEVLLVKTDCVLLRPLINNWFPSSYVFFNILLKNKAQIEFQTSYRCRIQHTVIMTIMLRCYCTAFSKIQCSCKISHYFFLIYKTFFYNPQTLNILGVSTHLTWVLQHCCNLGDYNTLLLRGGFLRRRLNT